jgi:hypothetical protein
MRQPPAVAAGLTQTERCLNQQGRQRSSGHGALIGLYTGLGMGCPTTVRMELNPKLIKHKAVFLATASARLCINWHNAAAAIAMDASCRFMAATGSTAAKQSGIGCGSCRLSRPTGIHTKRALRYQRCGGAPQVAAVRALRVKTRAYGAGAHRATREEAGGTGCH